jgi:hypothetical protein
VRLIKTINEVVRDRLNECVNSLVKRYMKSVRPIYGSKMDGSPYHIGSCVLIDVGGAKYLVTAAHVIDHNEETTLYVSGDNDLIQLEAEALLTSHVSGDRRNDKLDIAVLPLSSHIADQLGEIVFVDESSMIRTSCDSNKYYMALGFPNSKNKKINNIEKKVTQNPFVYSSGLILDDDVFREIGANRAQHYLLNFSSKYSKDENGNMVNSIEPKGASGGALISIEGVNDLLSYRPDSECTGRLAGILIENHKRQKVILATKMSLVLHIISLHSGDI